MKDIFESLAMAAGLIAMSLYVIMLLIFVVRVIKYRKKERAKKINIEITIGNAVHFRKEISKIAGLIVAYTLSFCLLTMITEMFFVLVGGILD